MKLFQSLFTPKWKNKNPAIRKQALIALDRDENQAIFFEIANHDDDSELRQLAVKRLNNLNELVSISTQCNDPKVRESAQKAISQILAGLSDISGKYLIGEAARIKKINALDDQLAENQKSLEFIALKGDTPAVRAAAINKVSREALLGDLAIKEPDRQARIEVAGRLSQKSTLERVLKAVKNKDKEISKIIKARLEKIVAEEQRPKQILAKQKSLCQSMENLGSKGLWERDKSQFDQLVENWSELDCNDNLELQTRFDNASSQFQNKYQQYLTRNEERLKEEAALLPIKQEKQSLLEQAHQLLSSIVDVKSDANEIHQQLVAIEQQWRSIAQLPDDIEQGFITQFKDVINSIKSMLKNIESSNKANIMLTQLSADINRQLKQGHKIKLTTIANIEKKLNAIKADGEHLNQLKLDIKQLISKAQSIAEKNTAKADDLFSTTQQLILTLDTAINDGEIKTANETQKKIQSNLKQLSKLGHKRLSELKNQDSIHTSRLFELNKWRSWANTPQKDRLIAEVEALIDSDIDPKEIAFLVSKARKEWQQMGPSEQSSSQQMWEQFSKACDMAYQPCKVVFDEESKIRAENYDKRVAFLNNLETFIETADWANVNWVKVENLYQQSRTEWQNLGPIDKNKRKSVNNRFSSIYGALKDKLSQEWAKNQQTKQGIIDKAKELTELDDLNTAINSAKDLQRQWKTAGRVQHHIEKKLWAEFRKNCDIIFSRRDTVIKQKRSDDKDNLETKDKLCNDLELLCNAPSKAIKENREAIFAIRKQILEMPTSEGKQEKQIIDRVNQALHIFEIKLDASKRIDQINSLSSLKSKIEFVQQLESDVENSEPIDWDSVVVDYEGLAAMPLPDWDDIINNRYKALQDKISSDSLIEQAKNNLPTIQASTIQLEIISEIDTPDEYSSERLKIQTQRLNDKLKNHNEESQWEAFINTEANWLLTGPLPSSQLASFKNRHSAVIEELRQQFPEELEDY